MPEPPRQPERICGSRTSVRFSAVVAAVCLALSLVTGCKGRSIKEDNPVFTAAPPRRSLVNQSADVEESRLVAQLEPTGEIRTIGFERSGQEPLKGTTVVATVNGQPVFLDDVLGGLRPMIETRDELRDEQRQYILTEQLRKRLPNYVEQEIVLQALNAKVPEDKREVIRESLEPSFQKVVANIKQDKKLQSDEQLNELLSREGMTIDLLRETFLRAQMVNGYVATLASSPTTIDRQKLVAWYQSHINEYTPAERVRIAEIVVRFDEHGGRPQAEKVMANVVTQLQTGRDFGDVASAMSDSLSAEKKGDMGWIERGSLADRELETLLFELPVGEVTRVQVRPDRFEVYKVINHTKAEPIQFQDVQKEIEQLLIKQESETARAKVVEDLKARSTIQTIFDKA